MLIVYPTEYAHSISHTICSQYIPQNMNTVYPTEYAHSIPHRICSKYILQNMLTVYPTEYAHSTSHRICSQYIPQNMLTVYPTEYAHSISHRIWSQFCLFSYVIVSSAHMTYLPLTHWGQVTHICVGNLTIIGQHQAIIWTKAGTLLIGPLWTNFSEIQIQILTFSFKKMSLKMLSAKWRPFCLDLNVSTFSRASLTLGQLYDCASEKTLTDMGKIHWY